MKNLSLRQLQVFDAVAETLSYSAAADALGITQPAVSMLMKQLEGNSALDAGLIAAAQKVEHYEIATYGGLVQLAITMGQQEAAALLDKTLQEEEDTDRLLTDVAVIGYGGTKDAIRAVLDGSLTGDVDIRPQDIGVAAIGSSVLGAGWPGISIVEVIAFRVPRVPQGANRDVRSARPERPAASTD